MPGILPIGTAPVNNYATIHTTRRYIGKGILCFSKRAFV